MTDRPRPTVNFLKFNRENRTVYHGLVRLTTEARGRRRGPLSIKLVYEGLRWESYLDTTGDPYRLSNSFTAYYARLIMFTRPELQDVFVLRPSVADDPGRLVDARQIPLWREAQRDDGWLEQAARDLEAGDG